MKHSTFYTLILLIMTMACQEDYKAPLYDSYDDYPVYDGADLGLTYSKDQSTFRLWAPSADEVSLHFYDSSLEGTPNRTTAMKPAENGTWIAAFKEDLKGTYYTFQTKVDDKWGAEVPDPYVKAVGTNGKRGQVIDLADTNPDGWEQTEKPALVQPTDIVIYELHVRDLSLSPTSGIKQKGKFLAFTEKGTKNASGEATGLDHIKDLGVTHVHLLPSFDYMSVDESKLDEPQFNWGYDPQNYNVPEGSYSTDPADGATRIREMKAAVKAMHDNGLRVILDVVYNHTGVTETSLFNELVPGYYYRQREDGTFSDASACGNETASDRAMVRKFIVESVCYWAKEYQLDGFRFDLMGIHDIQTMNEVAAALKKIDPSIFIYGEGWTAGDSPLPVQSRATKNQTFRMEGVAAFSDDIRDGLKGSVFVHDEKAFISGAAGREEDVKFGIIASTDHPQVDYAKVNYSEGPWANDPTQTISYVSCHDNHTLWDRLDISCPEASEEEKIQMHKLALAVVLTSQGVPFLHAGVEMLRTKGGEENSYKSPDSINQLDWSRKTTYKEVYDYTKGLIALRKAHPAFRMTTTKDVQKHLKFLDVDGSNLIAYTLNDNANGDRWKNILVALNGNAGSKSIELPQGEWTIALNGKEINEAGIGTSKNGSLDIPPRTAMVLYQQ
jgi:pullulanase